MREHVHAEEMARMGDVESLRQESSTNIEASESRVRVWADSRIRKEGGAIEEALERMQEHTGIVRALLDEAVKAVSKELDQLRKESTARDAALEDLFDERSLSLEERLTEIDNGAAKKRRLSDLSKETGAKIGEIEQRVRQVWPHAALQYTAMFIPYSIYSDFSLTPSAKSRWHIVFCPNGKTSRQPMHIKAPELKG